MFRHLPLCLALAALATFSPTPAGAAVGSLTTFDTVDAIEATFAVSDTSHAPGIRVTGILVGNSGPTTVSVKLTNSTIANGSGVGAVDPVARCDRMAMLAMSRPGKFQFALVETDVFQVFTCKLIVRAP
jgi:hypothetical protein